MVLPLLRPFPALRPSTDTVADVAAPPYDVLNSEEARVRAEGKPLSFLHVSKPEIDLAADTDVYAPEVYAKAAENFAALIKNGVMRRDPEACFYIYRLAMGEHVQTGIVGAASVDAYDTGRIRRHELTRPSKEDDRVRQIQAVNAHTGPVMVAHRPNAAIKSIIEAQTTAAPDLDVSMDGVQHSIWVVSERSAIKGLQDAFEGEEALYMADGHHRSNSAVRVAASRRAINDDPRGDEWYESFLTVVFPSDEMRILDYNRIVTDLNGLAPADLLSRLEKHFLVEKVSGEARPGKAREFGMYLDGEWYRLAVCDVPAPIDGDAVAGLDISLLTHFILEPLLAIGDPRLDPRIDFVGGIRGLGELARRVNCGDAAVAFAVYPTSMEDLIDVSDARQVMPPKSTWFEPKLADGLVALMLD